MVNVKELSQFLATTIPVIESGLVAGVSDPTGTIKAYKCGTIIRVDIKGVFEAPKGDNR